MLQILAVMISAAVAVSSAGGLGYRQDEATLAAVGDNLIHDVIYLQAREQDGSYDFSPLYSRVEHIIRQADFAYINQETPMVEGISPSNYPMFNTPMEMAEQLQRLGFDIVSISNNHMLDQGESGLKKTAELILSTDGLHLAGLHGEATVVEVNHIRFSFVGITQHLNVGRPSGETAGLIVTTEEETRVQALIGEARRLSDVVVVSVHWGDEESLSPNAYQKEYARKLAAWGADLIIGSHPHVLQPTEWLEGDDGRKTLVLYSLGNFVSAQVDSANLVTVIANIRFVRDIKTGRVSPAALECIPLVTHYEGSFRNLTLYPLSEYNDDLAQRHGLLGRGRPWGMARINAVLDATVGEYVIQE